MKRLLTGVLLATSPLALATVVLPTTDSHDLHRHNNLLISIPILPSTPRIAFTDLISGADTGLGDGKGSGAIVTVWGQRLGSTQGLNKIEFCDSASVCREPYVYYWKNADGQLPSSPANLYESHGMQEIAFSVPDGAQGLGTIRITTGEGVVNTDFTIRSGGIYHVMTTGDDSTGDGSYANPWLTVAKADSIVNAGGTIYIHDVTTGSFTTNQGIYNNRVEASGDETNQLAYVSYPNTRAEVIAYRAFSAWNSSYDTGGMVASKLSFYAAAADVGANDQVVNERNGTGTSAQTYAIQGTGNGRAVGNYITDEHPDDPNGACASGSQAAIVGNHNGSDGVSNFKVLGNHVEDYGCKGSIKFHHTTYLSIRSGETNVQIAPPEMSWNYLKNNAVKNGIHMYDENHSGLECGSFTGDVVLSNNVIINQGGAGINVGANCPWNNDFHIANNVIINSGLAAAYDGLDINTANGANTSAINITDGGLTGKIYVYNNTVIDWNKDGLADAAQAGLSISGTSGGTEVIANDNVFSTAYDRYFFNHGCCGAADVIHNQISGLGNVFYNSSGASSKATIPVWDAAAITTDPKLTVTGAKVTVGASSNVIGKSRTNLQTDIYGKVRQVNSNKGAIE